MKIKHDGVKSPNTIDIDDGVLRIQKMADNRYKIYSAGGLGLTIQVEAESYNRFLLTFKESQV